MASFIPLSRSASLNPSRGDNDDDWRGNALIFRGRRQALLASNLANSDTPGYRARDTVSFAETLNSQQLVATELKKSSPVHIGSESVRIRSTADFVKFAKPVQPALDGNTVDDTRDRVAIARNSILYQAAMKSIGDELEEFNMAASDPQKTRMT